MKLYGIMEECDDNHFGFFIMEDEIYDNEELRDKRLYQLIETAEGKTYESVDLEVKSSISIKDK